MGRSPLTSFEMELTPDLDAPSSDPELVEGERSSKIWLRLEDFPAEPDQAPPGSQRSKWKIEYKSSLKLAKFLILYRLPHSAYRLPILHKTKNLLCRLDSDKSQRGGDATTVPPSP